MLKAGVIGYGSMGRGTARAFDASPDWELAAVVDVNPALGEAVAAEHPGARFEQQPSAVLDDPTIDLVALTTLADARPALLRRCLAAGKHVWTEKPPAPSAAEEEALLEAIEASDRHVAVNLFNRNAWYHEAARAFIAAGEIGKVAIIRYRHQTYITVPYASPAYKLAVWA
ncbi:MAG: Gfo/Idh/MocA family protein [Planctomycetota bacterium]